MSNIRVLPAETSNRIAAGEVIERPASVVKELVENAVDAGAGKISVRTEQGGRKLIQVTDDGSGMDRDDAMMCIEAHATSKVSESYDIDRISTLGFRGEALPSIAGVSRFQLQTRQPDDISGTEILVNGGTLRDVKECGCPPGTDVRVQNLFFNLPARKKFLRRPATEDLHVQETVLLEALAQPDTAFELYMNDQQVLQVGGNTNLGVRIAMLLGKGTYKWMVPVDYKEENIHVTGFISRPGVTRSRRREQRVIVNGRPAQADTVFYGIKEAYHTLVMKGRYPPVVLYLDVPSDQVDVNVHPTKREVRFRNSRLVGQVVAAAVRKALQNLAEGTGIDTQPDLQKDTKSHTTSADKEQETTQFEFSTDGEHFHTVDTTTQPADNSNQETAPNSENQKPLGKQQAQHDPSSAPAKEISQAADNFQKNSEPFPAQEQTEPGTSPSAATRPEIRNLKVLGVIKSLYLVAEGQSGLVLIDQHAAHERILFEKILASSRHQQQNSQPLLLPVTIELSPRDADFLGKHLDQFANIGFGLESFGGSSFIVSALPAHIPRENVEGLIRDMLEELRETPGGRPQPDETRIAQAACKHAVRAEDPLANQELDQLLTDLANTEMPYTCPHGRPVMINIPDSELQKRFGRRL